jgi:hypothetical protein
VYRGKKQKEIIDVNSYHEPVDQEGNWYLKSKVWLPKQFLERFGTRVGGYT